jgi:outer membrane receptor for ferrienterochelin and colicin
MESMRLKHMVWVIALLVQTVAFAQTADEDELALVYGDKATISIATGSQQTLRRAPAVATVITAGDIAAMGATDLDEVLETVPGLHVNRSANVYGPLYVIRGVVSQYTPQTLVLQNGIPITTLFVGNKGNVWGGYPVEHIARIEVIRGPGSALYGADAYSGVINIITKNAADAPGTQVGATAGSFNTKDAWVQHGGKVGALDVAAYLRIGRTDGINEVVTADAQSRNDKTFGTHASLAPGSVHTGYDSIDANLDLGYDKWHFRAGYKLRDNMGTGAGVAQALDPIGEAKSERTTADLSWSDPQFTHDWGIGFSESYQYYTQQVFNLHLFPPGVAFPTGSFPDGMIGNPDTWERQFRFSAYATYAGLAGHRWRFGMGHDDLNLYKTQELKNFTFTASGVPIPVGAVMDFSATTPFLFPQRRKVNYLYVQDEWNLAKDWVLTAGVRHDRYSDFGNTTNPRAALVWDAALDFTAKLLYGRAFRAPAFNEEYSINNPVNHGNPNLRPETIKTMETVFSWQARKDLQINLNVFRYEMQDIIRTVPNATPGTGATFNNVGSQSGHGVETEVVWDINRNLRATGNYAYQHSIDDSTNQDAGYAPHHHLYARVDWRAVSGWLVSPQVNWVADRKRTAGDNRPPVPDYTTVDLVLRTDHGRNRWDFSTTIRNLFNTDAREPSLAPGVIPNDLPLARRAFYVQAQYSM